MKPSLSRLGHRLVSALTLALSASLAASLAAPDAHAIEIRMGSIADSRFGSSWTLDGSVMTVTRSKLQAATELTDGFTVTITDTASTLTPILLSQFDILFIGYLYDLGATPFSSAELDAIEQWVGFGGQLLLTCDHVSYDAVCERFGYVLDANSAVNPAVVVPAQQSHPIFDGPYGQVTQFLLWGSQGGFSSVPAGADVLAQSSNIPALDVALFETRGQGSLITLSDVDIMSNQTLSATTTFSGAGTNDNDHLLGNILARVDALIDGDNDGVRDLFDNCKGIANPGQTDADSDTFGAACDCNDNDIAVNPLALEACDGVNNDCNGATVDGADEGWVGTACDGADSDLCIEGTYVCSGGNQTCNDATASSLELCDNTNNDCNAATADGFDEVGYGLACDGTDGDLCQEGTRVCVGGVYGCNDATGTTTDLCNGTNDDCNGATANGSAEAWFGTACDGPDGDLCAEGAFTCTAGSQACSDATGDVLDVCDGANNDCDGASADGSEDPALGTACDGADTDLCEDGVRACAGGVLTCDDAGDELDLCNGADDDCNPATPDGAGETWFGDGCDETAGECASGILRCVAGARACSLVEHTVHLDDDGDGCGLASTALQACPGEEPAGAVENGIDLDDSDGACCGNGILEGTEECDPGVLAPPERDAGGSDGGATDGGAAGNGGATADASSLDSATRDGAADATSDADPIAPACTLLCLLPRTDIDSGAGGAGGTPGAAGTGGVLTGTGGLTSVGGGGSGGTPFPTGGTPSSTGGSPSATGGALSGDGGLGSGALPGDAGVEPTAPASSDEGGCGCTVPGRSRGGSAAALGLLALGLVAARRAGRKL